MSGFKEFKHAYLYQNREITILILGGLPEEDTLSIDDYYREVSTEDFQYLNYSEAKQQMKFSDLIYQVDLKTGHLIRIEDIKPVFVFKDPQGCIYQIIRGNGTISLCGQSVPEGSSYCSRCSVKSSVRRIHPEMS